MDGNFDFLIDGIAEVTGDKSVLKMKAPPKPKIPGEDVARVVDDELSQLGWSPNARLSFLGDVGRENNWNRKTIFGGHPDPKNQEFNRGIISWQGDRRVSLDNYLKKQGVFGRGDDEELRAMVRFADEEMRGSDEWKGIADSMRNPNISTYDASENLRKYIKYVPNAPYNTYDPEFRVKNNAEWAKRARELGLGKQADWSFLTEPFNQTEGSKSWDFLQTKEPLPAGQLAPEPAQKDWSFLTDVFDKPEAPPDIKPVPESGFTINAQLKSAFDPASPRSAVLLTEADQINQIPPEMANIFMPVNTKNGTVMVNKEKAKKQGLKTPEQIYKYIEENGFAKLIGKQDDVGNNTADGLALRTETPDGRELSTSMVLTPTTAIAQAQNDRAEFGEGVNQQIAPAQAAAAMRENEAAADRHQPAEDNTFYGHFAPVPQEISKDQAQLRQLFEEFWKANPDIKTENEAIKEFNESIDEANKFNREQYEADKKSNPQTAPPKIQQTYAKQDAPQFDSQADEVNLELNDSLPSETKNKEAFKQGTEKLFAKRGVKLNTIETEALAEYQKIEKGAYIFGRDKDIDKPVDAKSGKFVFEEGEYEKIEKILKEIAPQVEQTKISVIADLLASGQVESFDQIPEDIKQRFRDAGISDERLQKAFDENDTEFINERHAGRNARRSRERYFQEALKETDNPALAAINADVLIGWRTEESAAILREREIEAEKISEARNDPNSLWNTAKAILTPLIDAGQKLGVAFLTGGASVAPEIAKIYGDGSSDVSLEIARQETAEGEKKRQRQQIFNQFGSFSAYNEYINENAKKGWIDHLERVTKEFGRNLIRNVASGFETLSIIAKELDSYTGTQQGVDVKDYGFYTLATKMKTWAGSDPYIQQTIAGGELNQAFSSALLFAIGGAATKGSKIAIATLGALLQIPSMYDDLIARGVPEGEARKWAIGLGVPLGATEIVGIGGQANRLLAGLGRELKEETAKTFLRSLISFAKRNKKVVAYETFEEGGQEWLQSATGQAAIKSIAAKDKEGATAIKNFFYKMKMFREQLPIETANSIPQALIGAVTGATTAFATQGIIETGQGIANKVGGKSNTFATPDGQEFRVVADSVFRSSKNWVTILNPNGDGMVQTNHPELLKIREEEKRLEKEIEQFYKKGQDLTDTEKEELLKEGYTEDDLTGWRTLSDEDQNAKNSLQETLNGLRDQRRAIGTQIGESLKTPVQTEEDLPEESVNEIVPANNEIPEKNIADRKEREEVGKRRVVDEEGNLNTTEIRYSDGTVEQVDPSEEYTETVRSREIDADEIGGRLFRQNLSSPGKRKWATRADAVADTTAALAHIDEIIAALAKQGKTPHQILNSVLQFVNTSPALPSRYDNVLPSQLKNRILQFLNKPSENTPTPADQKPAFEVGEKTENEIKEIDINQARPVAEIGEAPTPKAVEKDFIDTVENNGEFVAKGAPEADQPESGGFREKDINQPRQPVAEIGEAPTPKAVEKDFIDTVENNGEFVAKGAPEADQPESGGFREKDINQPRQPVAEIGEAPTPKALEANNPRRIDSANPEAVQKAKIDTRAQKVAESLADGQPKTLEELQKATRYNQNNLLDTIDLLYEARNIEILPDNSVRLINELPKTETTDLYEKYADRRAPIELPKSSVEGELNLLNETILPESPRALDKTENVSPAKPTEKYVPPDEIETSELGRLDKEFKAKEKERTEAEAEDIQAKTAKIADRAVGSDLPEQTVFTERGTKTTVRPKVVPVEDLITSLDDGYPQEFQPRDRSRSASVSQISDIAGKLNPELLGDSPKASDGRPLVVPVEVNGEQKYAVISGNGRTAAIREAYHSGNEGSLSYAKYVRAKDPKANASRPVYVGVLNPKEIKDFAEYAKEANESPVASMSATEQAKADAERLDSDILSQFVPADDGSIHAAANRDFIRAFMKRNVGQSEQGRLMDAQGNLNQDGVNRVRNAIFAKAYGGTDAGLAAVQQIAESTDNNVRRITNALLQSAGNFTVLKQAITDGVRFDGLDITPDITASVAKFSYLRSENTPVETYLRQHGLFGDDLSPLQKYVLQVFDKHSNSAKAISGILNNYILAANALGDPRQSNLFGGVKQIDTASIFRAAVLEYEAGNYVETTDQTSIFDIAKDQGSEIRPETGLDRPDADSQSGQASEQNLSQSEVTTPADESSAKQHAINHFQTPIPDLANDRRMQLALKLKRPIDVPVVNAQGKPVFDTKGNPRTQKVSIEKVYSDLAKAEEQFQKLVRCVNG